MTMYREILRLSSESKLSGREIAASCRCSYTTVKRVLNRANELHLSFENLKSIRDEAIARILYPQARISNIQQKPDFAYVHKEIPKSGVTLMLLWNEYCDHCREQRLYSYMYTQFCNRYKQYVAKHNLTCHIIHKPGEVMEVDWAGTLIPYCDETEGVVKKASLFVACLPFSGYCYAEAMADEKQESWLVAHVHALNYFGGAPRLLRPDNLKTGVKKPDRYEPEINPAYRELSEYYGCFVSPARVRKPKDKPTVEGTVGMLTTHIIAALRERKFHSLKELNAAAAVFLRAFNARPFQKKNGSRESVFSEEERETLTPLPAYEYVIASYREVSILSNYHVALEGAYYSVPYRYAGKKATIRSAGSMVEIFCEGERIASHVRCKTKGEYSTDREHMPEAHRHLYEWDETRYLEWCAQRGPATLAVIDRIQKKNGSRTLGCRFCADLVSLEKKYGSAELEAACSKMLTLQTNPSLKSLKLILPFLSVQASKDSSSAAPRKKASASAREVRTITGFRRGAE